MKKTLALLATPVMALSLAACRPDSGSYDGGYYDSYHHYHTYHHTTVIHHYGGYQRHSVIHVYHH